jgi:hypothetical protein
MHKLTHSVVLLSRIVGIEYTSDNFSTGVVSSEAYTERSLNYATNQAGGDVLHGGKGKKHGDHKQSSPLDVS